VVEVRLFGELEAVQDGIAVPVRGTKQRALLALLALHRGEPVSADRLVDVLWGDGQAGEPGQRAAGPDRPDAPCSRASGDRHHRSWLSPRRWFLGCRCHPL
jgi:hypothetical protein